MWWLILCVGSQDLVFLFCFIFTKYQTMGTHKTRESVALLTVASGWWIPQFRSVMKGCPSYFDFQHLGPTCKTQAHNTQGDFNRPERYCLSSLEGSGGTNSLGESVRYFLWTTGIWGGAWISDRKLFNIFHSQRGFWDTREHARINERKHLPNYSYSVFKIYPGARSFCWDKKNYL